MVRFVRLRLARHGQKHRPFYRIVAAYNKHKRDGRHTEVVGAYNPLPHSRLEAASRIKRVWLNVDRIKYWLSVGAHPSDTVARLLGSAGLLPISPRSYRLPPGAAATAASSDAGGVADAAAAVKQFHSAAAGAALCRAHAALADPVGLNAALRPVRPARAPRAHAAVRLSTTQRM